MKTIRFSGGVSFCVEKMFARVFLVVQLSPVKAGMSSAGVSHLRLAGDGADGCFT